MRCTSTGTPRSTRAHRWVLVANLPYNVATPLVCDLLDDVPQVHRILVMVQREVAERFAASARTSGYGAVSVKAAYWGTARVVGLVPATVFVPRPKVESALVEITRHDPMPDHLAAADTMQLFTLVKQAFGQRRKMLRKSLSGVVSAARIRCCRCGRNITTRRTRRRCMGASLRSRPWVTFRRSGRRHHCGHTRS